MSNNMKLVKNLVFFNNKLKNNYSIIEHGNCGFGISNVESYMNSSEIKKEKEKRFNRF